MESECTTDRVALDATKDVISKDEWWFCDRFLAFFSNLKRFNKICPSLHENSQESSPCGKSFRLFILSTKRSTEKHACMHACLLSTIRKLTSLTERRRGESLYGNLICSNWISRNLTPTVSGGRFHYSCQLAGACSGGEL